MPKPVWNPPNPWASTEIDWEGEPPPAELEVYEEEAKTILASNESPDVGFRWSLNPYRGCYHGCAYCYARPTHQYLDWGAGTDFERRIVVKVNAPELLRGQFDKRSWRGETIAFSGITDCYQPLEAAYRLTRRCLEVCLEYRNPVGVITKGAVVRRDVDVLADLSRRARAHVTLSIPFADDETGRKIEPYASPISKRFETLRILSEAGISTGIAIAPVIPGLNDSKIPELLARAKDAGAQSAFMVLLRLPREVRPVFDVRLDQVLPERAAKIRSQIKQMRGGKMNEAMFHARMHGVGPRWDVIQALFDGHARRLGLIDDHDDDGGTGGETEIEEPTTFRRPSAQRDLFEDL